MQVVPWSAPTRGPLPSTLCCSCVEVIKEMRRKQENEESRTAAGDQDPTDSSTGLRRDCSPSQSLDVPLAFTLAVLW